MTHTENLWRDLCEKQGACDACRPAGAIHPAAKPLFGRFRPRANGILFVFEAPNLGDTSNAGYITYERIARTDETGKFTKELFEQELGIQWDRFQVTNAVLCLPKSEGGRYPVKTLHLRNCAQNLRDLIDVLQPIVIASVGGTALKALQRLYGLPITTLRSAAASELLLPDRRWLFPLFHTGRLGRGNRSAEQQRADWRALAKFVKKNGTSLHG
jgi:uracil-DNA glycosylase family 4